MTTSNLNSTTWTLRREEEVMGTVVVLDLYADASVTCDELTPSLHAAIQELHEADRLFSTYDPTQRTGRVVGGKESIGFVQFLDRRVQRGRQFVAGHRGVGVEVEHDDGAHDFLFSTQRPGG